MKVVELKTRMLMSAKETCSDPLPGVRVSGTTPPLSRISRRAVVGSSATVPSRRKCTENRV